MDKIEAIITPLRYIQLSDPAIFAPLEILLSLFFEGFDADSIGLFEIIVDSAG